MNGCKGNVVSVVHFVRIRGKGNLVEIVGKSSAFVELTILVNGSDKFFNVCTLVEAFVRIVRICFTHFRILNDGFYQLVDGHIQAVLYPLCNGITEAFQLLSRAAVKPKLLYVQEGVVNGKLLLVCVVLQGFHRLRADTTLREVDNTQRRFAVEGVVDNTKVGKQVLNFLSFKELEAAEDFIGNAVPRKLLFERAGKGVDTHKNSKVGILIPLTKQPCNYLRCVSCFAVFLLRFVYLCMLPFVVFRPKGFVLTVGVISNNGVCKLQNMLCRTVVALQLKYLCVFEVLFKVQNVFNLRPTPAVNRLVVVTYGKQIAMYGRKVADNFILHGVSVLELVHKHVAETTAKVISCVGVGFK